MQKPKRYKPKVYRSNKRYNDNNTGRKKGYDSDWEKYRFRFLHYNKYCYCCPLEAKVVDHILAHKGDKEKFKALNNHMPLCIKCHNTITAKFDKFDEPKTEEKMQWVNDRRKELGINRKIIVLKVYKKEKR